MEQWSRGMRSLITAVLLLIGSHAYANNCPSVVTDCPSPTYNNLNVGGTFSPSNLTTPGGLTFSSGTGKLIATGSNGWVFQTGNGGDAFQVNGSASSTANWLTAIGAGSGSGPILGITGTDSNVQLKLSGKGGLSAGNAGAVQIAQSQFSVGWGTQTLSSSAVQSPMLLQGSFTGTATGTPLLDYSFGSQFTVTGDTAGVPTPSNDQFMDAFQFNYNWGGSGMTGNRVMLAVNSTQKAATSNTLGAGTGFYTAARIQNYSNFNDAGSGLTGSTAHGRLFALGLEVTCDTNATNWWQCAGMEINSSLNGSALVRDFLAIASTGGSVQGTAVDAGIWYYNAGATALLQNGILFGSGGLNSWPIASGGTIIATDNAHGPTATAAIGIDFSPVTFSSFSLKMPGWTVDGSGNEAANTSGVAKLGGAPGSAPGASRVQIFAVAGTNAGSCKLQALAGTSTTPVTILDNIGSGC